MHVHISRSCVCYFTIVIKEPNNVTVCEGKEAVFTCVLNKTSTNINRSDVQWCSLVKDTGITEMVYEYGQNIHYVTYPNLTSTLTIRTARQSYAGYFWVKTPSDTVGNATLTVLSSMLTELSYNYVHIANIAMTRNIVAIFIVAKSVHIIMYAVL